MAAHYLAPITGLNYYFVLNALRLARWRQSKDRATHAMADSFVAIAALRGIFIWNYQEGYLIELAGAARAYSSD
mgnify:CR=1 FL=1